MDKMLEKIFFENNYEKYLIPKILEKIFYGTDFGKYILWR